MKRLVCEMCGGSDLIKENGVFVCQNCGCKYSVEEAKKMMVEGTVDVSGSTVKIDDTDKAETYKDIAINAYNSGNTSEAYQYFLKVLEIDPSDYQSIFYKGMCQGWETTLARPRVDEAFAAFCQAENYIPEELFKETEERFLHDLIGLMSAWFELAQNRYFDVDEWYDYNLETFWDYLEVSEKIIGYIDDYMQIAIDSDSEELISEVGELYCSACEAMCTNVVEWLDYSREKALFPGLSGQAKAPILMKYDNMIFEVRKYNSSFRKIESKYSVIDRMNPPVSIGAHNLKTDDINYQKCLKADKEINERVKQYKTEKLKKIKEEKEKRYWEKHPEDKVKSNDLKEQLNNSIENFNVIKERKKQKEKAIERYKNVINSTNDSISEANDLIAKQRRKIFGKAKAQEVILQTEEKIKSYKMELEKATTCLNEAIAEFEEIEKAYNDANMIMQSDKRAYEDFMKECGL